MGTWGTAISSNDTFADIYSDFFELYNEGLDVGEISTKLIANNQEIINDIDDCHNFWFALAKAKWECKALDSELFVSVKEIIESGRDLEVWKQHAADEKTIEKRRIVLNKFLTTLQSDRFKKEPIKKQIIQQPYYEKGECLTFKLSNGNYGGIVILESIRDTESGLNLIATTRIDQISRPTKNDFLRAKVLILNYGSFDSKPLINWYLPIRHKKVASLFEKVAIIDVNVNYIPDYALYGVMMDLDIWIIWVSEQQFASEGIKSSSPISIKIKELTNK